MSQIRCQWQATTIGKYIEKKENQGCCLSVLLSTLCLVSILCHIWYLIGFIVRDNWKGRGNQYIQLNKLLYCKLQTSGKQDQLHTCCQSEIQNLVQFGFICCFTSRSTTRVILQRVVYGWRNQ